MVKNIPTIERSTKIRFGKHVSDSQAENTIVFNASNTAINATNSGSMYMAPLRVAEIATSNLLSYSPSTKEVVDSSVPTTLLGGVTLQSATENGNTTDKFIGIQNTAPTHAISVADTVFIHNVNSADRITVVGNVRATTYSTTTDSVLIQDGGTPKIQVSGRIISSDLVTSKIGLANNAPEHVISIGNKGQVRMNIPTESIYALDTVGNVNAQNYRGDSYYLSNLTVENIVNQGNVTSNTVQFTNGLTSIYTTSNVDVGGNIFVRDNTNSAIYGTIAGANTIAGSTITASTRFNGPGIGLTDIPINQFATGAIAVPSGGTGQTEYVDGTILYGKLDGATSSLGKLNPLGSNADLGKFLKLGSGDIPEWSTVPLTLDAVLGDTTAASGGSMSLTDTGTTITTDGKIKAATFEGSGSDIHNINAANVYQAGGTTTLSADVLPVVPVTKGGTNLNSVTAGDILYASANDTIARLTKGNLNEVLQMKSDGTLPEWTSTITTATLANPSLTGNISTQLDANRIPFTNSSKALVTDSKLQFDGSNNKMTIGTDVEITGKFTTRGAVDHLETTNYTVTDPIIEVGNNNSTDTIDLGMIMTMGTANVVHGFRGNKKEYTIAYTHSNPSDTDISPTLTSGISNHPYITANIWGNVLSGNVTTTGKVTSGSFHGNSINVSGAVTGGTLVGVGSGITQLNAEKITTGVLAVARGGTNIDTYTAGDILYASGSAGQPSTTLTKLAASDGKFLKSTASAVEWADVSSTLDAVASNGPAGANVTSNTIQFTNTVNSLTASGNVVVSGNVISTGVITLESSAGTRQALKVINAIEVDPAVVSGGTSSKNVLAINRTTGEIYDSGGQGGSTLDNIHEEGSNVSIGPSAWAGPTGESNLTMNTYGSNVLTVTGNVSATNITIGGLHVAASPFDLDDVCSGSVGANVITSNVIQFTGPHASYGDNNFTTSKSISIGSNVNVTGNIFVGVDTTISGNVVSQNLQLTNTQIASSFTTGSGTLTIDCKNKSYGTAPLTTIDADVAILSISDLPSGGQVVVPLLASGSDRKVLKTITAGIDQIAFTNDVSIAQSGHGLLTVSKLDANIYMNAISFTAA